MSEAGLPFEQRVLQDTQRWLERAVIGLNLCPFAKAVLVNRRLHCAVSMARSASELLDSVGAELEALRQLPETVRETTLLIAPCCLHDFLSFNEFMAQAGRRLVRAGLEGTIQLVSFHPLYEFADAAPDDIGNCTNRAPYPTVHLLRESSIDRAVQAFPEPERIFGANLRTLQQLGPDGWSALGVGPSA